MEQPQHVLIQGGGIAGLSLAIALARRQIRSTVFEIRAHPTTIGGAILLNPNALRVLDRSVGVWDELRAVGFQFETLHFYADDGLLLLENQNGSIEQFGYPSMSVRRNALHGTLKECAEKYPGLLRVRWDASIESITEREDGVTVQLLSGEIVEGSIVVGADGIHSKVRTHVLGGQVITPRYTGIFGVGGLVRREDVDWVFCELPAIVYSQAGMLLAASFSPDGAIAGWSIQRSMPERTREGWHEYITSGQALEDCRSQFPDAPQPVRDILAKTIPDSIRGWPPYEIDDLPTWHTSRVVLVGDAAHAIPPYAGQGSAQAFEDIGFLARLLGEPKALKNGYEAMFAHFEQVRRARFATVREITRLSGMSRNTGGGWLGFVLKKYLMWGASRLMSGSFAATAEKIYSWDVDEQPLTALTSDASTDPH